MNVRLLKKYRKKAKKDVSLYTTYWTDASGDSTEIIYYIRIKGHKFMMPCGKDRDKAISLLNEERQTYILSLCAKYKSKHNLYLKKIKV